MKNKTSLSNLETVREFYSYLDDEIEQAGYSSQEISSLRNPSDYYGRYLSPDTRNYIVQTYFPNIARAISYLSVDQSNQYLFDLGCGLGMQSLIFASLGAKVVAVDMREGCIALCNKRKSYYEQKLNMDLDIEFRCCDFREIHSRDFDSRFDGLFSMSAFARIAPLDRTVKLISALLKDNAKVFSYDSNSTHLLGFFFYKGEELPNPNEAVRAFEREGFDKDFLDGAASLPKVFWKSPMLNRPFLHPLNNLLKKSLYLSFHYVLGMKRCAV